MSANATILSTKKLSVAQKELLLNAGIGVVAYSAIEIEILDISGTYTSPIANAIFTSKNAVKAIQNTDIIIDVCFCVGENTKKLLEENGQKVVETAKNASDLGKIIAKKHKTEQFSFFCGNIRRDELPAILKENDIHLEEKVVYKTHIKTRKLNRNFDGVFFFSPSGVQSYFSNNVIGTGTAFCIGNTTASEIKKYTNNIIVANKPTVENVIVQAVKYFDKRI
ncbi:uroporphyrinogen-III synthase [Aquimarina sp. 2201CG14-23]|uniref:uroporphyrinogen-III synthase n=1 Tax=Aquimarina mycalae TaxID=3040073 RepID=UPI002477F6E6|nr:uroporphyrinogen-III synthase [Aquimarina sp. 2201CG14-23]MDH7447283.1 uroporphyrinogen-III synthase [Aquimarina sp. 2201CG14-23]